MKFVTKILESYRSISKTKRYGCLFKGSIVNMEDGFLFAIFYNTYLVIHIFQGESKRLNIRESRYLSFHISYNVAEFLEVNT